MATKRYDNIDRFLQFDIDVDNRIITLGNLSDDSSEPVRSMNAIKNLRILDNLSPNGDKPITIIMNHIGGDVTENMAIFDAILSCNNKIIIEVYGCAMSMGSIILQAADERVVSPNSKMMLHYGQIGLEDHVKNVERALEENKKYDAWMEDLYLERIREKNPKFTKAQLKKLIQFDYYISAEEAVELGLADSILE